MFLQKFDQNICDEIIEWFLKTSYAKDMENCLNGIDEYHLNPYHQERSILDHSLMVSEKAIEYWRGDDEFYIYFLSGLVHDIGKIRARSVEQRNSSGEMMCIFRNHENMGFYLAADILFEFWKTDMARKIKFSYNNLVDILKIVTFHDIYKFTPEEAFDYYRNFRKKISKFSICDTTGRIIDKPKDISKHIDIINSKDIDTNFKNAEYRITFMVGLPSSGKSTLSDLISDDYKYIISRDEIVENFDKYLNDEKYKKLISQHDIKKIKEITESSKGYNERFKVLHIENDYGKYVDSIFMNIYHNAINSYDGNILIDKTNLSKKGRKTLMTFNTKNNIGVSNKILENKFDQFVKCANILVRPYSNIVSSDITRGNKTGKEVIDKFIYSSNFPNYSEFDYIEYRSIVILGETIEKYGEMANELEKYIREHKAEPDGKAMLFSLSYWFLKSHDEDCGYMELYEDYIKFIYKDSYVKMKISF